MSYSAFSNVYDPEALQMLVQVFDKVCLKAKREFLVRDLTQEQEQELRQQVSIIIFSAYAEGVNDPELLEQVALARLTPRRLNAPWPTSGCANGTIS